MLNEERKAIILNEINEKGSANTIDLMKLLDTSESTIRRTLNEMNKEGLLKKVHGGAISNEKVLTQDDSMAEREVRNIEEKAEIARFAASLVKDNDVIYLDAGTTTFLMIPYLKNSKATFFTNSLVNAKMLSEHGHTVYIPGGILKAKTEAIVGNETCEFIKNLNFTMGFFGTNGISKDEGFTTPDLAESAVKKIAIKHSREKYILADSSKYNLICTSTFGNIDDAMIISNSKCPISYQDLDNIVLVDKITY